MYLVMVTETNVDGCGGMASEFIQTDVPPTDATLKELESCLAWAKETAGDGDETVDMVERAVKRLNVCFPALHAQLSSHGIPVVEF